MKRIISIALSLLIIVLSFSFGTINTLANTSADGNYVYTVNSDNSASITEYKGREYNVSIPENIDGHTVKSIKSTAFTATGKATKNYKNTDLIRTVTIPKTVTDIEKSSYIPAGGLCTLPYLKRIDVNKDNPSYASQDGVLFNKDKSLLICYPSSRMGTNYTVPASVKTLGEFAFDGAYFLQSVKIGKNLTAIKTCAFIDCRDMEKIYIPKTVKKIGKYAIGCKSSYISSFYDEFWNGIYNKEDFQEYEYFEGYTSVVPGFTVYGEKNTAAEKYCKKIVNENLEAYSLKFKTVNKKKPAVKVKVQKNKAVIGVNWYDNIESYEYKIYKGKKLWDESHLAASSEYKKNSQYVRKFKVSKGTYTVKVRANINVCGYKFRTPWSDKVKFKVK